MSPVCSDIWGMTDYLAATERSHRDRAQLLSAEQREVSGSYPPLLDQQYCSLMSWCCLQELGYREQLSVSDLPSAKRRRVQPEVTEDGTMELPIKFNRFTGRAGRGSGVAINGRGTLVKV